MNGMKTAPTTVTDIFAELKEARQEILNPEDSIWRDNPATLEEFVQGTEYLRMPSPLTPVQYNSAIQVLGEDPKKVFELHDGTGISTAVLEWGKGSGKDYMTSVLQLYITHIILCLEEPQVYFGMAPGEPLDVVNVAYSAEQAKKVYFTKFVERLKRCVWFRKYFDLSQSGRLLDKRKESSWGQITIGATGVDFPGNIRAISESSENESYEGYNIIFWIMDEASAFKSAKKQENAKNIYNTLRSSANTRFVGRWKGFILSYPRTEDEWDFTTKLYNESLTSAQMYGSREYSWNVAPASTYPGPKYKFIYDRGDDHLEIMVPEVLREDFDKDPEDALGKYCCMPSKSQGAYFELAGAIPRVFVDRKSMFTTESMIIESRDGNGDVLFNALGYNIVDWDLSELDKHFQYVAHVDCGLTDDRAALVIAHGEPTLIELEDAATGAITQTWTQRVVEDGHIVWEPDRKRNLRVSLRNIETVLIQIHNVINLTQITYDRWNSAGSIETLSMKGIVATEHNINRGDYDLLRSCIYANEIDLIYDPLTEFELTQLRKTETGRVDHPEGGSKDLSDAIAGVVRIILKDDSAIKKKARVQNIGMPRRTSAHTASTHGEFSVGPVGGNTVGSQVNKKSPLIGPGLSLADAPPMPFGLDGQNRPRPSMRLLPGSSPSKDSSGGGGAIGARLRGLAK